MGTMACTMHISLCNGFHVDFYHVYVDLHNVHVDLQSVLVDLHNDHVVFTK